MSDFSQEALMWNLENFGGKGEMKKERLLITGGSGFIGTNFISDFSVGINELQSLDIASVRNHRNNSFHNFVDIEDLDEVMRFFERFKPTKVLHLAARTDLDGASVSDYSANTHGVENIVKACNESSSVERVLYASSRLVCPIGYTPKSDQDFCPNTPYGESKVAGEKIVREKSNKKNWVIFRPTSIWGPWFGVPYNGFFKLLRKGLYFHPKGKKVLKSFGYVGNSVYQINCLLNASLDSVSEKVFYLCDHSPIEISEWAAIIQSEFGVSRYKEVPDYVLRFAAKCGDGLKLLGYKNPPLTSFRYQNMCAEMLYETDRLMEICGELPFDVKEGVLRTVNWMLEND